MLTSKPPFQSSTTDEIYRRARNRDYEWPKSESTGRYISQEAKDLVASMLVDADMRPEPDQIVQDDFFLAGYVPTVAEITSKLRDCPPDSDQFYAIDLTPQTAADNFRRLKELCRGCEVGPWNHIRLVYKSTWREVALEEKAGLTPMIPLAEGIVYRPYEEVSKEQKILQEPLVPLEQPTGDEASATQQAPTNLLRAPPQSFAAQQRAQNRPPRTNTALRSQPIDDMPAPSASGTLRARVKRELPQSSSVNDMARRPSSSRPTSKPSTSIEDPVKSQTPIPQAVPSETRKPLVERPRVERPATSDPPEVPRGSLFSSAERKMAVPETHPDVVLDRLQRLQAEIERALNARSMAIMGKAPTPSPPHIVVKWVDYSNKFGLGYILNDGSVGCVLKSIPGSAKGGKTVTLPPSCILVRDAEQHCSRRHDPGYLDRHQIVPMAQAIQFYENNGETGLSTVFVHPSQFKIETSADGTPGKVPLGRDIYDYRKREHLILWKKFANYMMAYGRDQDATTDDTGLVQVPTTTRQVMPPNDVVTFYQRIGDVGCWVFADGHLQFNFPDHTKIVLDATGTWCHFWHLPQEAAEKLAKTGELDETALDERAVLSYPLQTLLNFSTKPAIRPTRNTTRKRPEINPMLQGIPTANDFRRKIEFIRSVIKEWVTNGGLGNSNMDRERRLQWTGCRETVHSGPSKHVWVTIGARWGDERFSAVVDPKKPGELGGEVESKRSA
ncbi:Cell cycle serine/threonine-protein kinase cdc5/MSD2 [Diatrype stigma]|uniref:Cell cycle serine/threonine-protein kinase cdc5/MSD2 n=1 Tax=Diatrype stigma TaxID=117547 RepID=A0AAN9UX78_9PEZI